MTNDNPREQQPHETMTVDQRLAILMTGRVQELSREKRRLEAEAELYTDLAMTDTLMRQAKHLSNAYDRLVQIVEALAGGNLYVVNEYRTVKALEGEIQRDRDRDPADEAEATHYSPLRVAQLALTAMKEQGAIR